MRTYDEIVLEKIISLLQEQGKKQKELTDFLGISKNVFSDWKAGKNVSFRKYMNEISQFFNVDIDYFFPNINYTNVEEKLIKDFRSLSDQGQEYILQTMDLAVSRYKKDNSVSQLENIG